MRFVTPAAVAFVLSLTCNPPGAHAAAPLALNEIMAGPARDWDGNGLFSSRDDEWVEVINTGATPLDLGAFFLTDADSIPRYAFAGMIGAGERALVFGKDAYDWERTTAHPAFGLSLGNAGDEVILWQVTGADTAVIDRCRLLAHEAASDRAVGRVPEGGGAWMLFDALNAYTGALSPGATGCAPTPGQPNACSVTPVRTQSWGRIKALYR